MKVKANSGTFEPCPEYTGKAVCVDVTPLRKQMSPFGERDVFKIVFEVDALRKDGTRFAVWSPNFTPTLNKKSGLRAFLRNWMGRDLTPAELDGFDTECLLGVPAQLVVVHHQKDDETYANIAACTPDKSADPLKPSGKFTRAKDRQDGHGSGAANGAPAGGAASGPGYRRAEQRPSGNVAEHALVKVHVGKYTGIELRDLNQEAVQALCDKWLPAAKSIVKPTADDKRLVAALEWWLSIQTKPIDALEF